MKDMSVPLTERYRPKLLSELVGQDVAVATLQGAASGNTPHLLLHGPAGVGKTTAALALARALFGGAARRRTLELNASDERGIQAVRERVKEAARNAVGRETDEGRELPPFKLIVLDECDAMTQDAQGALRRIIEAHASSTRFVLICNFVERVIEPLRSRCAVLRFRPLSDQALQELVVRVAQGEGLPLGTGNEGAAALVRAARGDARRAVQLLQSAALGATALTAEGLRELTAAPGDEELQTWVGALRAPGADVPALARTAHARAYDWPAFHAALTDTLLALPLAGPSAQRQKARAVLAVARADANLASGSSPYLQLLATAYSLHTLLPSVA